MLIELQDADGLISLRDIEVDPSSPRNLFLRTNHQPVYIDPFVFGVAEFIFARSELFNNARLRLHEKPIGRKMGRIFGPSFAIAMKKVQEAPTGCLIKSMYKLVDPVIFNENGQCATLVVHIKKTLEHLQIEAWQTVEADPVTYYLHGMRDNSSDVFWHIDGATMIHNSADAQALFEGGQKVKGCGYQKFFRIDGAINVENVLGLASAYLPSEELSAEYFEDSCTSKI